MTDEQPTRVDLKLSFPGSRTYTYETELPADWHLDSDGLDDYVQHHLLPQALAEAGLKVGIVFPEGATGITADAVRLKQELGAAGDAR